MKQQDFGISYVIEKWYKLLNFDKKYDDQFYEYLNTIPIPADTSIATYPISCTDGKRNLLSFLYMCDSLCNQYAEKGIPEEILLDTLHDLVIWSEVWSELKGELWLGEIGWLSNHMSGILFKLGRLQFAIQHFSEDFIEYGIKEGECNIGVHISAMGPLTQDACVESFAKANAFFVKFFPEIQYNYYTCHSWLLDDTLKEFLPENSNIIKFGDMFNKISFEKSDAILRYVFKWDSNRDNISRLEPTSSFAKKVKDFVLDGTDFYEVFGIRPV